MARGPYSKLVKWLVSEPYSFESGFLYFRLLRDDGEVFYAKVKGKSRRYWLTALLASGVDAVEVIEPGYAY